MGISSRDYARDDSYERGGGSGWLSDTPTVRWLLSITVVTFILQLILTTARQPTLDGWMLPPSSLIDQWFALNFTDVMHGQVWRLLSYAFLHDRQDPWHLIMNMLVLWFFGCTLERMYGSREFLLFYLAAAVFAGIGFLVVGAAMQAYGRVVGASGAVMAVMMLYGMHFPRQQVWIWFIPVEIRFLIAFYVITDMYPLLLMVGGDNVSTGVAHSAHLSGLLFGFLYHRGRWKLESMWDGIFGGWSLRWRRATTGRNLRVYQPQQDEANIDDELDRILVKIHELGSESLTDRERRLLTQASEKFKRKL